MTLREKHNWNQDTPAKQLVVIYQAMWGWQSNFEDGTSSIGRVMANIKVLLQQLEDLLPFIEAGTWEIE